MPAFSFNEFLLKFHYPLAALLIGLILVGVGFIFYKSGFNTGGTQVEVLSAAIEQTSTSSGTLTVEIAGEVVSPGVYKLPPGSRIDDLLIAGGGFSANADRKWSDKYLNRAGKITDGQKIYVPTIGEQSEAVSANTYVGNQTTSSANQSDSSNLVNINTASLSELDTLPGIGQVYGQNIIEHRPYSTTQELVSKGAIKQSLYDKVKDKITIY